MKGLRVFAIAIVLVACIGVGAYLSMNHEAPVPPVSVPAPSVEAPAAAPTKIIKVYQMEVKDNQTKLRPTEVSITTKDNPIEASLRKLFGQGDNGKLANPIPKGTKLIGLKIKKGLATLNLSHEFKDNFTGGSEEEGLTMGAILRTLEQFPEIKRVQFLIEGQPLDTLGHLDLSGPQDVHWAGSQFGGDS